MGAGGGVFVVLAGLGTSHFGSTLHHAAQLENPAAAALWGVSR